MPIKVSIDWHAEQALKDRIGSVTDDLIPSEAQTFYYWVGGQAMTGGDPEVARWRRLCDQALRLPAPVVRASLTVGTIGFSKCKPVWVRGEDGLVYAVKVPRNHGPFGRTLFTDHVVGRLGALIGAPVANVALVELSAEQLMSQSFVGATQSTGHGSLRIDGVRDAHKILHRDTPQNRPRFALLAILFGWVSANDRQYLYDKNPPFLVHSADHGDFFPYGPDWSERTLHYEMEHVRPDEFLMVGAAVAREDVRELVPLLERISDHEIAEVVSSPPDSWGVSPLERALVARYLSVRRDILADAIRKW